VPQNRFRFLEKNRRWCGAIFFRAVPETFAMVGWLTDARMVAVDSADSKTLPDGRWSLAAQVVGAMLPPDASARRKFSLAVPDTFAMVDGR
jgi:hypothetical protein